MESSCLVFFGFLGPLPTSLNILCVCISKIAGIIDEVNAAMLENILTEENDAFVFFYDKSDPEAHTILEELEQGLYSVLS